MTNRHKLAQRLITATVLVGLLAPNIALAQFSVVVANDPQRTIERVIDEAKASGKNVTAGVIMSLLANLVSFAANRLAYDAAVAISSAGPGQEPLFDGASPTEYFSDYGKAVAGEAIGQFQEGMKALGKQSGAAGEVGKVLAGFNVCAPRDPNFNVALSLGIRQAFERPEPRCDFDNIEQQWGGFIARAKSQFSGGEASRTILNGLKQSIDPSSNDFSIAVGIFSNTLYKANTESLIAAGEQTETGGFKGVSDFITGQRQTPARLIEQNYTSSQEKAQNAAGENVGMLASNEQAFLQVGLSAAQMFTNTLLSRLTQRLYDGAFKTSPKPDPFAGVNSVLLGGRDDARNQYRSYLSFAPLEISNYSLVSEFISCPPQGRGLYNCVMNTSFATALARAEAGAPMTLKEAIDEGMIDGSWPLIPAGDQARNQDPYCYTYGFCHTNLLKMRKARIIPVGWELAAASPANNDEQRRITLGEVVDNFNNCSATGELDAEHPWCKLIDPNWVLKYPDTQCRAEVYGQLLELPGSDTRQSECVDMPSCVAENEDGTCAGYGYCTQEENVWKFRGEACEPQYASCRTLEGPEGDVAYLMSTVNQTGCNESNAGCRWYATNKTLVGDAFAFDPSTENPEQLYLNGKTEECDAEDGGCRELIRRTGDLQLNLIANASFEDDQDNNGLADQWTITSGRTDGTGEQAFLGSAALVATGGASSATQGGIALGQGRFYTLSAYSQGNATVTLELEEEADMTGYSITGACTARGNVITLNLASGADYQRATCTFTTPRADNPTDPWISGVIVQGFAAVDALELEQTSAPTLFNEGYSATNPEKLVAKVPPAYLGCTGSSADPAECANYALMCSEEDVGCRQFTPENGDPAVTGVATSVDACPNECVGYDAYRQEPTKYEPTGLFPLSFIPATADTCKEQDVGCSEFTNLATEARGYFTDLRQCSTESFAGTNKATYYTWEGSDETGYQLKTWNLLKSNETLASYTHSASGTAAVSPGLAPCTNVTGTAEGLVCNDDTADADGNGRPDWDLEACDERSDIFRNPDCREFYDASGNIHYRAWSKTVTVDNACTPFRKTATEGAEVCAATGGYFDDALGACRYFGLERESLTCSDSANGCRAYSGGRSRNSRTALLETFEGGDLQGWDIPRGDTATYSNESLANGGHSVSFSTELTTFFGDLGSTCTEESGCLAPTSAFGKTCTVAEGDRYCGVLANQLTAGKTYTLSFLAKGEGSVSAGFDTAARQGDPSIDTAFGTGLDLSSEWREFSLGPLDGRAIAGIGDGTALVFSASGGQVYLDNVVLREGEDNVALISGSWSTPASCDSDPTGQPSPGYYLGCRAYTDSENERVTLKSFSRLCDSSKVGCDSFYLTQESDSPYAETYESNGTPVTVLADQDIFLVMTDAKRCDLSAAGCQELGLPTFDAKRTGVSSYKSAYLINDPDSYGEILCGNNALFCDAYTADDNTRYYFKSPVGRQCEYRTDVQVDNRARTGWFIKGTSEPCYEDYVIGGSEYGLWKNGDSQYADWVGACTNSANHCTEFQDPLDVPAGQAYGFTSGESYFYLNNDALAQSGRGSEVECNGRVSLKEGCALFEDPATPGVTYNASATEMLSRHADTLIGQSKFGLVQPVVCGASPQNNQFGDVNLCAQRCQYNVDGASVLGGSCLTANDCSDVENTLGEPVEGSCVTVAPENTLANDTDTILKVNRDRTCGEWLACYSSQQVWDERQGRYRSVCEAVASCTEYSANAVGGCSAWNFNKSAIPLDQDQYAARNVSWYGQEYSGYSIPNQIGVEHLSQVDTASDKTCQPSKFEAQILAGVTPDQLGTDLAAQVMAFEGTACEDDNDCGGEIGRALAPGICQPNEASDYRLAYDAGSCTLQDRDTGACTVGICENNGSPCSSTSQCGAFGGECVIGQCLQDTGTTCTQDADCGGGQICNGVVCANVIDDGHPIEAIRCASGRLVNFAQTKTGSCVQDRCLVSPQGTSLATQAVEPAVCRAYPEKNSPFKESVVALWNTFTESTPITDPTAALADNAWDIQPYSFKSGFDRVSTCVSGEDCACNYKKLSIGQSQTLRYIENSESSQFDNLDITTLKICTNTGDSQGKFCGEGTLGARECDSAPGANDGRCEIVKKEEVAIGQLGYCLERDSGLKINGSATEGACVSWLPVDRVAGSTDTSAKSVEALYGADEINYCSKINTYADVGMATGCSERLDDGGSELDSDADAQDRCMHDLFSCPPGMFAVVSAWDGPESPIQGSHVAEWARACEVEGPGGQDTDNSCPFICVPQDAADEETQKSCEAGEVRTIAGSAPSRTISVDGSEDTEDYTFTAYWVPDPEKFNNVVSNYENCVAAGRLTYEIKTNGYWGLSTGLREHETEAQPGTFDYYGWYNYRPRNDVYLACEEYLSVQTSDFEGAPKTNELYLAKKNGSKLTGVKTNFAYAADESPDFFGAAESLGEIINKAPNPYPSVIAQCVDGFRAGSGAGTTNFMPPIINPDGSGYSCIDPTPETLREMDLNNPQARAFTDFDGSYVQLYGDQAFADGNNRTPMTVAADGGMVDVLSRFFARTLDVLVFRDGVSDTSGDNYSPLDDVPLGFDPTLTRSLRGETPDDDVIWDNRSSEGVPPTVWAIDPMSCEGTTCAEGPANKITLNGQNQGTQESEEFFTATVKFYAAADANQLPLRRVVVDWGDGKLFASRPSFSGDYTSADNFFKNARGFQQGTETPICNLDTEWGKTADSCSASYFQASHVYSCRSGLPDCTSETVRKDATGQPMVACYDSATEACIFRPRVHVRDNWGFCAGTCQLAAAGDASTRCYAGNDATLLDTGNPSENECDIESWNDLNVTGGLPSGKLPTGRDSGKSDPWVYYDGVIYVK